MITPRRFAPINILVVLLIVFISFSLFSSDPFYSYAQDELNPTIQAGLTQVAMTIVAGGDPGGINATVQAAVTATAVASSAVRITKENVNNIVQLSALNGHDFGITSVAFSPDGKSLLSSSFGTSPILWDIETGKILRRLVGHTGDVTSIAISPDGHKALSSSVDTSVILWNLETGEVIYRMVGHSHWVMSVAFSPDGKQALSGSVDKTLILWDLETGKPIRSFTGHTNSVQSVAFNPDGKFGASGSCGGYVSTDSGITCNVADIFLWDLNSGEHIRSLQGHKGSIYSLIFSQDGQQILSGASDKTLILWDVATAAIIRRYPDCNGCEGHTKDVKSVSLSNDGQLVLSGSDDNTAIIWDLSTAKILRRFEFGDDVRAVSFGPLNKVFAAGLRDHSIGIYGLP